MKKTDYELVSALGDASDWETYHRIRREELFDAKGRGGIYDANRAEEKLSNHFPLLLSSKIAVSARRVLMFAVTELQSFDLWPLRRMNKEKVTVLSLQSELSRSREKKEPTGCW
jgi:hypothetical protein